MSHIAKIKLQIKDLDALAEAAQQLGCELVRDQKQFIWYAGQRGECAHALRVPNAQYEIGVVQNHEGHFELLADFWATGGLEPVVGKDANHLKQAYGERVAIREAQRQGFRIQRTVTESGAIRLSFTR